jgi:hypothetical protein
MSTERQQARDAVRQARTALDRVPQRPYETTQFLDANDAVLAAEQRQRQTSRWRRH